MPIEVDGVGMGVYDEYTTYYLHRDRGTMDISDARTAGQDDAATKTLATGNLPGHLVRRLHQVSVSIFMRETRSDQNQITPLQHAALVAVRQFPGVDQAGLADLTACDRVTVGGVVSRLEQKNYISRRYVEGDKRSKRLFILPAGEALLEELQPAIEATQDYLLEGLTDIEKIMLIELLKKALAATNDVSRAPLRPGRPLAEAD